MARNKSVELIQDQTLHHFDKSNKKNDRSAPKMLSLKEQLAEAEKDKLERKKVYKRSVQQQEVENEKPRFGDLNRDIYAKNLEIIKQKELLKGKGVRRK